MHIIRPPLLQKKKSSYFENGTMKEHKTAPKGVVCLFLSLSLSLSLSRARSLSLALLYSGYEDWGMWHMV
jgi:hypothetical protein